MALFSGIGDVSGTGGTSSRVGTTEYKQLPPVYENVLPKYEQLPPKYEQVSPTSDPSFAKLLDQILNVTPTALPGIEQLTAQGMNSPLLQLVLGPALQRLQAPQAQARQNLTEQTRAAGGLRGSTYGQDMNKLVANQGLQQNDLMSQVIQQILGTLVSGQIQSQQNSMLPGKSLTELLRTIAPQTLTGPLVTGQTITGQNITGQTGGSSSSGWGSISPSQGLNTPMSSGTLNPQQQWDQMNAAGFRNMGPRPGSTVAPPAPSIGGEPTVSGSPPPPQYIDPWSGGSGGGSYDLGMGAGTQWLNQPAPAITEGEWTYASPEPGEWW